MPEQTPGADDPPPVLDVVIPVFNEAQALASTVRRVHHYLSETMPYSFRITIADNASTDATGRIAQELAAEIPCVTAIRLDAKGRGRALKAAWGRSDAQVLAYMDVDLSTGLTALLPLVAPLVTGHSDLAIGTRLHRAARVARGPKRELISRSYNLILKGTLRARFSDAQCGFKAIRADAARELLPLVRDTGWFFDTELLVLAERAGLRVHEVPVDWVDDPDSRVAILPTAIADLRGIVRLGAALTVGAVPLSDVRTHLGRVPLCRPADSDRRGAPPGMTRQAGWYVVIGTVSTAAYLVLYALLRVWLNAQPSNVIAMVVTTIANTAANRRFTFGVRGSGGAARHQVKGLALLVLSLGVTAGALALLQALSPGAGRLAELSVLLVVSLLTAALRFVLMRVWVFRATSAASPPRGAAGSAAREAVSTSRENGIVQPVAGGKPDAQPAPEHPELHRWSGATL